MNITLTSEQLHQIIKEEIKKELKDNDQIATEIAIDLLKKFSTLEEQEEDVEKKFAQSFLEDLENVPDEDKEEVAEIALYKLQSRRELIKKIGIGVLVAGLLGSAGGVINGLKKKAYGEDIDNFRTQVKLSDEFEKQFQNYKGPALGNQAEAYLNEFTFTAGELSDVSNFTTDSDEEYIASVRRIPTTLFIDLHALLDKPIPKLKANTGKEFVDAATKFFLGSKQKVGTLYSFYSDYEKIGQFGNLDPKMANINIKVQGYEKPIEVLPPEWTILHSLISDFMSILSKEEYTKFRKLMGGREEEKAFLTVQGQDVAVSYGHYIGVAEFCSKNPNNKICKATAVSLNKEYGLSFTEMPASNFINKALLNKDQKGIVEDGGPYKFAQSLVMRGYKKGILGEPNPGRPIYNDPKEQPDEQ